MKKKRKFLPKKAYQASINKQIARERIQILENLIKESQNSPYNKRYKELIKLIKKKYKPYKKVFVKKKN